MRLLLAMLVVAGAAHAEGFRASVSVGTGVSHDALLGPNYFRDNWLGVQLELGYRRWSGFIAYGSRPVASDGSIALGVRWSNRPDGSGFGLALQGSVGTERGPATVDDRQTLTVFAASAHWRWKLSLLFIDVGAGPAVSFNSYRFPTDDYGANNGKLVRAVCFGVGCNGDAASNFLPLDLEIAIGFGL
jgi:hypothetical protein